MDEALGLYVRCIDTIATYHVDGMLCCVMGQVHAHAHAVHFAFVELYDDVGVGRVHGNISPSFLPFFPETRRNETERFHHATPRSLKAGWRGRLKW